MTAASKVWHSMSIDASDEQLVKNARSGDAAAFAALVRRHGERAYRIAARLCGPTDAEDVVQDAFIRVHAGLAEFRGDARFTTWLYRVVANVALSRRRRQPRTESLDDYLPRFGPDGLHARLDASALLPPMPDDAAARAELRTAIAEAMADLPDGTRVAFVLRDLDALSTDEVAAVLGIDAAAVRQRVHRARLILRGALRRSLGGEP